MLYEMDLDFQAALKGKKCCLTDDLIGYPAWCQKIALMERQT